MNLRPLRFVPLALAVAVAAMLAGGGAAPTPAPPAAAPNRRPKRGRTPRGTTAATCSPFPGWRAWRSSSASTIGPKTSSARCVGIVRRYTPFRLTEWDLESAIAFAMR